MRKCIVSLILILLIVGIGWELIGVIPLNFIKENPEPEIREFLIKRWIDNMKTIHPHCEGAEIFFIEDDEDPHLLGVYGKCYKFEI